MLSISGGSGNFSFVDCFGMITENSFLICFGSCFFLVVSSDLF